MDEKSQNTCELPTYLLPLLEPRPCGEAKLLAAWDGLCTEHQILLLDSLGKEGHLNWTRKIRAKALTTPNAYVRYLAARGFCPSDKNADDLAVNNRISEDPEPLVRYAPLEGSALSLPRELSNPEAFFALPQEGRLALMRSLPFAHDVPAIIRRAIQTVLPGGAMTEDDLAELLLEYVTNVEFASYYRPEYLIPYDGWAEHERGKDIEALWELVPDLPKRASSVLICHLPEQSGINSGIPKAVLNGMADWQLTMLFRREDIDLEYRKKVFFEHGPTKGSTDSYAVDSLIHAAISHNFDLAPAEFAEILKKPEKERTKALVDLAQFARDLSLCIFQAIEDVLGNDSCSSEAAEDARQAKESRFAALKGEERESQLVMLRLYEYAKGAAPWKHEETGCLPSGEAGFLEEHVIRGDTWGTFLAFVGAWEARPWNAEKQRLDEALRRASPFMEKWWGTEDEDSWDDSEENSEEGTMHDIKQPFRRGDFDLFKVEIRLRIWEIIAGLSGAVGACTTLLAVCDFCKGMNSRAWTLLISSVMIWMYFRFSFNLYREVLQQWRNIREVLSEAKAMSDNN